MNSLPVFVYGTLRNPFGNYQFILSGHTLSETRAKLANAAMCSNGGFPYVVRTVPTPEFPSMDVVGDLMHLNPDTATETMRRLDMLEGYSGPNMPHNHYDRTQVEVITNDGEKVTAWTYIASPVTASRIGHLPLVESGDWAQHKGRITA